MIDWRTHALVVFLVLASLVVHTAPAPAPAAGAPAAFKNDAMETDADADGVPDGWTCETGMSMGSAPGRNGGKAFVLRGPDMAPKRYALYAEFRQAFELKKGQAYRLSLVWRAGALPGRAVGVTFVPGVTGVGGYFAPPSRWQEKEWLFVATGDVRPADDQALRIGLSYPGTVLVDDVCLQEIPLGEMRPLDARFDGSPAWPAKAEGNLVANASFELGRAGWDSWTPRIKGTWGHFRPAAVDDGRRPSGSHRQFAIISGCCKVVSATLRRIVPWRDHCASNTRALATT